MKCVVQPGKQLAHDGQVLEAGAVVDLPIGIALEVRHLVHAVSDAGEAVPIVLPSNTTAAQLERELSTARDHEKLSILESYRGRVAGDLDRIDAQIAGERARLAPAKASKK